MRAMLVITTLLVCGPSWASETCSMASLRSQCDALSSAATVNDVIEFSNGFRMPACASALVRERLRKPLTESRTKSNEIITEVVRSAGSRIPPRLASAMSSGRWTYNFQISESTRMSWPPESSSESRSLPTVSPTEVENYWRGLVGDAGYAKLLEARELRMNAETQKQPEVSVDMTGQNERRRALFDRAKQSALARFLDGRALASLSPSDRELYNRMNAVKLDETPIPRTISCDEPPGASNTNGVGVSPLIMLLPDETIMRSMLHEISHSIDLCAMSETKSSSELANTPYFDVYNCVRESAEGLSGGAGFVASADLRTRACGDLYAREAFADWFAADVLANDGSLRRFRGGVAPQARLQNPRRIRVPAGWEANAFMIQNACSAPIPDDSHPRPDRRVLDIFLREPTLASEAGCQPTAPACSRSGNSVSPRGPFRRTPSVN